jgi:hypothetical protein
MEYNDYELIYNVRENDDSTRGNAAIFVGMQALKSLSRNNEAASLKYNRLIESGRTSFPHNYLHRKMLKK